jgi:hypothetical protein
MIPKNFNEVVIFAQLPLNARFIEALSTCNEVATRIPLSYLDVGQVVKVYNALRAGGKRVLMADWEPVFIEADTQTLPIGRAYQKEIFWACPPDEKQFKP